MDRARDRAPPPTAIVTGAAGWLGRNLVRSLAADRERVRGLVLHPEEAPLLELAGPSVEAIVGDVRDPASVDLLFDGTRGASVFHAAAVIHPTRRVRELFDVNVGGTELVVDRARRAAAARLVHVSSNSPFGANPSADHRFAENDDPNPYLAYGRSKLEAERIVQRAAARGDLDTVIVRPPWFYGPYQPARQTRWLRAVRRGRFPVVGDGGNRRSMVFTGNLVHGLLRAEVSPSATGRAYWVADPEPYAMADVLETVRRALRAEGLQVSDRQPRLPGFFARLAEGVDAAVQAAGRYSQSVHVLGELDDTIACEIGAARRDLGYEPATTLLDGMRASIRWCLERGDEL